MKPKARPEDGGEVKEENHLSEDQSRLMIQEVIVVEGKDDIAAIKKAVDCECIATHGYGFSNTLLDELEEISDRRGIIIFTDPDYAGNRIRAMIREAIPNAKHAFLDQAQARRGDDIGVENASPAMIRQALMKARASLTQRRFEFDRADMLDNGFEAVPGAKERRIALSRFLNIGYGNAKQMLARLNDYGIQREEFEEAVQRLDE